MKLLSISILSLFILFFSCDEKQKTPDNKPALRDTISLQYGESVQLANEQLSIHFQDINESRCPKNVTCIRAGEAVASLQINQKATTQSAELQAKGLCFDTDGSCGETKEVLGYRIKLLSISPYPGTTSNGKAKEQYTIQLIVDKSQS